MQLMTQFHMLGRKQLAFEEGIALMRQTQVELGHSIARAESWGMTAILSNIALVPLNCIVNAFQLKTAKSLYEVLVHQAFARYAASGKRTEGWQAHALSLLKDAIVSELKRKGLTDYVPGVNILIGLAQDSMAALQVAEKVGEGSSELRALAVRLDLRIAAATAQMNRLGIQRAQILDRIQLYSRTA